MLFKLNLEYFKLGFSMKLWKILIMQNCWSSVKFKGNEWSLSKTINLGASWGTPSGVGFSRCIEDPLVAFRCFLLFGQVVVSLTHSTFPFSILIFISGMWQWFKKEQFGGCKVTKLQQRQWKMWETSQPYSKT